MADDAVADLTTVRASLTNSLNDARGFFSVSPSPFVVRTAQCRGKITASSRVFSIKADVGF